MNSLKDFLYPNNFILFYSGVSGAPTGSVVGNASSAGGGPGPTGQSGVSSNFGPHSDGGGGDGFEGGEDKNEVESILMPNKHSWWNLIALCRKVFRSAYLARSKPCFNFIRYLSSSFMLILRTLT